MPPKPRTSKHTPAHINAEKLPTGVWYAVSGVGKWMLKYKDAATGKWRSRRLCAGSATLAEIWQAYESLQQPHIATFATLSAEFQTTYLWRKLSALTQRDYLDCHRAICNRETSTGRLGDIAIKQWSVGLIRRYRDKRAEHSESRANKELSYIKRVFAWAVEYEKLASNPAKEIKKLSIAPRRHYAEDRDYYFLLDTARRSGYWYLPICMELAYLCCMRLSEVLDLTDANALPEGLLIKRRKGSRNTIVEWTPRLRAAWDAATAKRTAIYAARKQPTPLRAEHRYIIISERTGDRITDHGLKTAKDRTSAQAVADAAASGIDYTPFTFHDIKKKAVTDSEGDKMKSSGHRSPSMMNIYDLSVNKVKPTRDK